MSEPIRLRVVGGPDPHSTNILDQDGRELRGVVAFTIRADASNGESLCTLELCQFDFDLEIAAVARRFGLPRRPYGVWFMRPQPWWVNASAAIAFWAVLAGIAGVSR